MIVIVDYGMGNLRSILNKLERIDVPAIITSKEEDLVRAEKIILPGVGAFDHGMKNLENYRLISILNQKVVEEKTPVLGICLGMQLFCERSEEGNTRGLGWIDAEARRFRFEGTNLKLKIPHMGWNSIIPKKDCLLLEGIPANSDFYFVHSYYVLCRDGKDRLATTEYGHEFTSAIHRDNIYGTQFHPEKSHKNGIQLLENFAVTI